MKTSVVILRGLRDAVIGSQRWPSFGVVTGVLSYVSHGKMSEPGRFFCATSRQLDYNHGSMMLTTDCSATRRCPLSVSRGLPSDSACLWPPTLSPHLGPQDYFGVLPDVTTMGKVRRVTLVLASVTPAYNFCALSLLCSSKDMWCSSGCRRGEARGDVSPGERELLESGAQ